ncbi:MAG TPA: hypothetical protein VKA70_19240 [Blastocatellia bacterium]|nr:hypothetical protein [Blastocatellia bacterium]
MRSQRDFVISYTQSDVDTIRNQVEQTEAAKRRWLMLALVAVAALFAGAVILLSTSYALYSSGQTDKDRLAQENAGLKTEADDYKNKLTAATALQEKAAKESAEAQAKLESLIPVALNPNAGGGEISNFARTVYALPNSRIELAQKPPDKLFRNWKSNGDAGTEIYALVGGYVDGKWVIYSNLVARR